MGEKPVTDLAGVGETLGKRLESAGFDKVIFSSVERAFLSAIRNCVGGCETLGKNMPLAVAHYRRGLRLCACLSVAANSDDDIAVLNK